MPRLTAGSLRLRFAFVLLASLLAAALLAACGGDEASPSATATPGGATATATGTPATGTPADGATPTATGTPPRGGTGSTLAGPALPPAADGVPDLDVAWEHMRVLAEDIGIRSATTAEEREAAEYIASVLREAGYEVALETFPVRVQADHSHAILPDGGFVRGLSLSGSGLGEASGPLVYAGLGAPEDLAGLDVAGAVVVVDRGVLTFGEKAANAEQAGAAAVIIVNNQSMLFRGTVGNERVTIPSISVAGNDGPALLAAAERGEEATVRAEAGELDGESQNVVGRLAGEECRAYIGAHYDSVPEGPGANDNASGTAAMMELARAHRTPGLCVIAFGAEEFGLFGSRAYVQEHDVSGVLFLLNLDMMAKVNNPLIIGSNDLTRRLIELLDADERNHPLRPGSFPSFASSDHASFQEVGVPAVTIYSGNDVNIHTPQDDMDNVDRESFETMLTAADVMVRGLLGEAGARD